MLNWWCITWQVGFKGLNLCYKNQSFNGVWGNNCCLFSDKYKIHKYSVGRAYTCWMLNLLVHHVNNRLRKVKRDLSTRGRSPLPVLLPKLPSCLLIPDTKALQPCCHDPHTNAQCGAWTQGTICLALYGKYLIIRIQLFTNRRLFVSYEFYSWSTSFWMFQISLHSRSVWTLKGFL
jgi:hypothetical protein